MKRTKEVDLRQGNQDQGMTEAEALKLIKMKVKQEACCPHDSQESPWPPSQCYKESVRVTLFYW